MRRSCRAPRRDASERAPPAGQARRGRGRGGRWGVRVPRPVRSPRGAVVRRGAPRGGAGAHGAGVRARRRLAARARSRSGGLARPARPLERGARLADRGADREARRRARGRDGVARRRRLPGGARRRGARSPSGSPSFADGSTTRAPTTNDADAAAASEEIPFDAIAYSRPARSFAEDLGARVGAFERRLRRGGEALRRRRARALLPGRSTRTTGGVRCSRRRCARTSRWSIRTGRGRRSTKRRASTRWTSRAARRRACGRSRSARRSASSSETERSAPLAPGDLVCRSRARDGGAAPRAARSAQLRRGAISPSRRRAILLRAGDAAPRTVKLDPVDGRPPDETDDELLPAERVAYGAGDAVVVAIHDVRDDLGDLLARTIAAASARARWTRRGRSPGVVLDLRGNGGGSTDGAIARARSLPARRAALPDEAPRRHDRDGSRARAADRRSAGRARSRRSSTARRRARPR